MSWRALRDRGDENVNTWFNMMEVMQQFSASWIADMRLLEEGMKQGIIAMDLFWGGLSNACQMSSALTNRVR